MYRSTSRISLALRRNFGVLQFVATILSLSPGVPSGSTAATETLAKLGATAARLVPIVCSGHGRN